LKWHESKSLRKSSWTIRNDPGPYGEIDIVESFSNLDFAYTTLHTEPGGTCTFSPPASAEKGIENQSNDCAGDIGCSVQGPSGGYGTSFNNGGGGVYAMEVSSTLSQKRKKKKRKKSSFYLREITSYIYKGCADQMKIVDEQSNKHLLLSPQRHSRRHNSRKSHACELGSTDCEFRQSVRKL
jgi:hypothetical protein